MAHLVFPAMPGPVRIPFWSKSYRARPDCNGRKEQTSLCGFSQSVKNTDSADSKGYDVGIKRHIAVVHVTTADVTDDV